MKIDEAIEILIKWDKPDTIDEAEDCVKAKNLGIEALKRVEQARDITNLTIMLPLPGETP